MAAQTPTELPELLIWLTEMIEPVQGQQWQITLNSNGGVVEAIAKIEQSTHENKARGQTMTITRVTKAKFRLASPRKTVFSTDA